MAGTLQVRVVTPEKPVFEGEADFVVVPAHDGEMGILPGHARLLASLGAGELRIKTATLVERFFVQGGFVQVSDDKVTVLCERGSRLLEIDLVTAAAQAAAAAERAIGAEAARLRDAAAAMRRVALTAKRQA